MKLTKKLLSLLLTLSLLVSMLPAAEGAQMLRQEPVQQEVDYSAQSKYVVADALEILKSIVGMFNPTPYEIAVYTFTNNNGKLAVADALEILKSIVGMTDHVRKIPNFPPLQSGGLAVTTAGGVWTKNADGSYSAPGTWNRDNILHWHPNRITDSNKGEWEHFTEDIAGRKLTPGLAQSSSPDASAASTSTLANTSATTPAFTTPASTAEPKKCINPGCTVGGNGDCALVVCQSGNVNCRKLACEERCKVNCLFPDTCPSPWSCQADCNCGCPGRCGQFTPCRECRSVGCTVRICQIDGRDDHPKACSGAACTKRTCEQPGNCDKACAIPGCTKLKCEQTGDCPKVCNNPLCATPHYCQPDCNCGCPGPGCGKFTPCYPCAKCKILECQQSPKCSVSCTDCGKLSCEPNPCAVICRGVNCTKLSCHPNGLVNCAKACAVLTCAKLLCEQPSGNCDKACKIAACTKRICEQIGDCAAECFLGNPACIKLSCEPRCTFRVCLSGNSTCRKFSCEDPCEKVCTKPDCARPYACQPKCECCPDCDRPTKCGTCRGVGCEVLVCQIPNRQSHPFECPGGNRDCERRSCETACERNCPRPDGEKCDHYNCMGPACARRTCSNSLCVKYRCQDACVVRTCPSGNIDCRIPDCMPECSTQTCSAGCVKQACQNACQLRTDCPVTPRCVKQACQDPCVLSCPNPTCTSPQSCQPDCDCECPELSCSLTPPCEPCPRPGCGIRECQQSPKHVKNCANPSCNKLSCDPNPCVKVCTNSGCAKLSCEQAGNCAKACRVAACAKLICEQPSGNCAKACTVAACTKLICEQAGDCAASCPHGLCGVRSCQAPCNCGCTGSGCDLPNLCRTCNSCDTLICQIVGRNDHPKACTVATCTKRTCEQIGNCGNNCPGGLCAQRECQGEPCQLRATPGCQGNTPCQTYSCQTSGCPCVPATSAVTTSATTPPTTTTLATTTTTPPTTTTVITTPPTTSATTTTGTVATTTTPPTTTTLATTTTVLTTTAPITTTTVMITTTTPPTTTTAGVTTTTAGATTTTAGVTTTTAGVTMRQTVLFDMHTHPNIDALAIVGSGSSNSDDIARLPFVVRDGNGTNRTIAVKTSAPRTITITGRNGSLQAVQFRLAALSPIPNHTYRFEVGGTFALPSSAVIRNGVTSSSPVLETGTSGTSFGISVTRTIQQIEADIVTGGLYGFGSTGSNTTTDMVIDVLRVVQVCPTASCTSCTAAQTSAVTSATTPATTPPVGDGNALFDMHTASNLDALNVTGGGSGAISQLPYLSRDTGPESRTIAVKTSAPRTITISGRSGSLQGIQFRLNSITLKTNHTYRFEVGGTLSPASNIIIRNGATSSSAQLALSEPTGTTFSTSTTRTVQQITNDIASQGANAVYSIGTATATGASGGAGSTIVINHLRVVQVCPAGCTACVRRTITFNPNGGTLSGPTTALTDFNGRLESLPTPTMSGRIFTGWFTSATNNTWVGLNTTFNADTTIFAQWRVSSKNATGVDFAKLTAAQLVEDMGTGWNLGNTLDAYPNESSWSVPLTTKATIDGVRAAGFDTIRIPVTWHPHVTGTGENAVISTTRMNRVRQIVDWAVENDLYIILNTHHDEELINIGTSSSTPNATLTALWTQIANRFINYNHKLIFEGINEPRPPSHKDVFEPNPDGNSSDGYTATDVTNWLNRVNSRNQAFVNAVRATGGNNAHRILMVPTYAATAQVNAMNAFRVPTDLPQNMHENPGSDGGQVSRKIAWSIHTYHPVGFAVQATTTEWAETGTGSITSRLTRVADRAAAMGIPVILGEWGITNNHLISSSQTTRTAERARYANAYMRVATSLGMRGCLWDNGKAPTETGREAHGHLDRVTGARHFPAIVNAIMAGRRGESTW